MGHGLVPNWTLVEYCHGCAGLMHVKRFDAMTFDTKSLVIYDRNRFDRNTVLGAWKMPSAVLNRWFVEIFLDARFADYTPNIVACADMCNDCNYGILRCDLVLFGFSDFAVSNMRCAGRRVALLSFLLS